MVRAIKKHPSLFGVAVILAAIPFFASSSWISLFFRAQAAEPPAGFASTMLRVGLGPEALAAAGVSDAGVEGIVQGVLAEWNESPTALAAADAAYVAAKQEKQRLERLVQSGRAAAEDVADYQEATSAFAGAEAARSTALDALFDAGVAGVSDDPVACLSTIRANRAAGWTAPTEFLVETHTEAEWVALIAALANERISAGFGETADGACQTMLATERADEDVAAAGASCTANLDDVRAAWSEAVGS